MSLFKRLFGIRRANKADQEDSQIDFEVKDLKQGYILDYDLQSWEVKDVAVYTWDNGVKDYEYTINSGSTNCYLNYESVEGNLSIYEKANFNDIWVEGRRKLRRGQSINDDSFIYKQRTYYFAGEGTARVRSNYETYDLQNWLFEDEDGELLVSFNRYTDGSMDAYTGKHLPKHAIGNILKR